MNQVPAIGGARGIFEIFVPGLFLLVNIVATFYFSPWTSTQTRVQMQTLTNPLTGLVLLVCLGYLLGVLLRLARADTPDRWSSWYLKTFDPEAKNEKGSYEAHAVDHFPYFTWLEQIYRVHMPPAVVRYFKEEWKPRKLEGQRNKPFFNLCKISLAYAEKPTPAEVYAAEAMTRYVACMFYALRIALVLALISAVASLAVTPRSSLVWLIVAALYAIALWVIIKNFRLVRVREADTVFAACFAARIRFEGESESQHTSAAQGLIPDTADRATGPRYSNPTDTSQETAFRDGCNPEC